MPGVKEFVMVKKSKKKINHLENISLRLTYWIGTPYSIVLHTILFVGIFALIFLGVSIDKILLILTTAVSLEAIYLAIFIQMTVNRHSQSLESVEDDIEDIQEDVKELGGDVEDISEDVEDISEDIEEDEISEQQTRQALQLIQDQLKTIQQELKSLKK